MVIKYHSKKAQNSEKLTHCYQNRILLLFYIGISFLNFAFLLNVFVRKETQKYKIRVSLRFRQWQ